MTGADTTDGLAQTQDANASAPVAPNIFRETILRRVERLKALRNPTVDQIENRLFWEAYLAEPHEKHDEQ